MGAPLSTTAGIVAVLNLSSSVASYLRSVKNASKECRKLLLEVEYIRGLLDILRATVQGARSAVEWDSTVQVLNRDGSPLDVLQKLLSELEVKLKRIATKQGVAKALASLNWPLNKKESEEDDCTIER
jgi:intein-encoded DNA endonuclease-like protein